ncbi:hypothetical protein WJX82_009940 [Trebouxia sp. C0006]
MAHSFPAVGSTQQSPCCTCHLVHQQLQDKQRFQLSNLTAHCRVSSIKRPAALLGLGKASIQSTTTKREWQAGQPLRQEPEKQKRGVADQEHKGVKRIQNKFRAFLKVDERNVSLGLYSTEDEAARVVDEGHVYQGLAPVNFKNELYNDDVACVAENVDQFAKLKRFQSRQFSKAQTTSRFRGVRKRHDRWECYMHWKQHITLGSYGSEEGAASVYDEACIYQYLDPVNFPDFPYDEDKIRQPADLSTFVEQKRKQAVQATKAGQSTRFIGVTWSSRRSRWAVNLTLPTEQAGRSTCVFFGCFDTDEEAARVADKGRIRHGLKAVNFPHSQYDHHQLSQVVDFREQSRAEARRIVKARQLSRFTGVSWNRMIKKWEAYVYKSYVNLNQKKGSKKRVLGYFAREEDAALAADRGRVQNGQKAVNSEEMTRQ